MAQHNEKTFILLKPDAVQRGLVGEIITRLERKGFKLVALKFTNASPDQLKQHYAELANKPFFAGLISFTSSGPIVAMVWEGLNVVKTVRALLGQTNPADSAPGTIRGDMCIYISRNLIHGSDSIENANKEIKLWFADNELVCWKPTNETWLYEH